MQGQRTVGSFPANVSMTQGPSSSGTDTNHQPSLNHMQNAVDFRLSDYRGSSGEDVLRLEKRQFEPNNVIFPASSNTSLHGNHSRIRPSFLQGSSSNHISQNVSLDMEHMANTADRGKGKEAGSSVNNNNTTGLDSEQASFGSASCNLMGTSSESSGYMDWRDGASSSSSLVNWGSSCKRKALEGSSRQLCTGGSSSSLVQSENGCWPTDPADPNGSSNLSVSAPLEDIPVTSPSLQQTTRNELRQEASSAFPLISVAENVQRPLRNFERRITQVQLQDSVLLNLPSTGSARHHNHSSPHQIPGSHSFNDSLELRLTAGVTAANSSAPQNQSPALHSQHFPWNRAANPRGARSSTSYNSGERAVLEDSNLRVFPRDSTEHPINVPASSGPTGWHMSSGNVNHSGGIPPTSWIVSGSNVQSLPNPSWIVNHEVPTEHLQRLSDFSPWSPFPSLSTTSGVHNGHSTPSPSGPPSFTQGSSSNQSYPRTALLTERRVGDVLPTPHSLRALTVDNEGRRRLISEVLFLFVFLFLKYV